MVGIEAVRVDFTNFKRPDLNTSKVTDFWTAKSSVMQSMAVLRNNDDVI